MSQLPNFSQSLKELIACPSISSTQPSWDQGNIDVIQLLATWFEQLGFTIEIQKVPTAHHNGADKFNLLAKLGSVKVGYYWPATVIPYLLMKVAGKVTRWACSRKIINFSA